MNIVDKVKSLNLPLGSYVVFGSAPLQVHGIRNSEDIDIVVTPEIYDKLKNEGWQEISVSDNKKVLIKDVFDVGIGWSYGNYQPDTDYLIQSAEYFDGIPFVNLEEVLKWKKEMNREKDLYDIELINKFLNKSVS